MNLSLNSLSIRFGLALAALVTILAVNPARAESSPSGVLAFSIAVPAGKLTAKEVHDIVLKVAIGRGWGVKEDAETKTITYLNHRKYEATVTYLVSDTKIDAFCEGYATDGKGMRKGPKQPEAWLKNLQLDINKGLNAAVFLGKK
jgi:hypothetical protein